MATALTTVADYVADARVLLQDTIASYRYSDAELVTALNIAMMDTRRLRPDLFLGDGTTTNFSEENFPVFTAVNTDDVPVEMPFRLGVLYAMCTHALARDQEDVQDARATAFFKQFREIMIGL
jgi:hypothetical protein